MRMPTYLSPSSLKTFEKNREEFYLKYLCENRPERLRQTQPMAAGSAFDGYVKSYIHKTLFGNYGPDDSYSREKIFESQVEPHNRDWAKDAGQYLFERYSQSGALADMMMELGKSINDPRFEFRIEGKVESRIGDIPLLGLPDIFFMNERGARVIWDWKVNGFCGKSATSPAKGYTKCRDGWRPAERRNTRNNGMPHKNCILQDHLGIMVNGSTFLEDCNTEWADQVTTYGWLLGEPIGSENLIFGIDQLAGCGMLDMAQFVNKANQAFAFPYIRVASHRCRISSDYQFLLLERYTYMWKCITSGHIFTDMTRKENDEFIKQIERKAEALAGDDPLSKFINRTSRNQ